MHERRWMMATILAVVSVIWAVMASLGFTVGLIFGTGLSGTEPTLTWLLVTVAPASAIAMFLCVAFRNRAVAMGIALADIGCALVLATLAHGWPREVFGLSEFGSQVFVLIGLSAPVAVAVAMPSELFAPPSPAAQPWLTEPDFARQVPRRPAGRSNPRGSGRTQAVRRAP